MRVVGLDLSYTRTGFAVIDREIEADSVSDSVRLTRHVTSDGLSLLHRVLDIKNWVVEEIRQLEIGPQEVDLIVVEGPGVNSMMASMMSGLDFTVMVAILETFNKRVGMLVVPPRSLKKYEEVSGNAKSLIVQRLKENFLPNAKGVCHDEADAFFLALLGVDFLHILKSGDSAPVQRWARHILYNEELNKKNQRKGLSYRIGEYYFPPVLSLEG